MTTPTQKDNNHTLNPTTEAAQAQHLSEQVRAAVAENRWSDAHTHREAFNALLNKHGSNPPQEILTAYYGDLTPAWTGEQSYEQRRLMKLNNYSRFAELAQKPFRPFQSVKRIGPVIALADEINPRSRSEWERGFVAARPNLIEEVAEEFYHARIQQGDRNITRKEAFDVTITSIIDQTYDGHYNELYCGISLGNYLESKGYKMRKATAVEDVNMGADFIFYPAHLEHEPKRAGIQLKPKTYRNAHERNYDSHRNNCQRFGSFTQQYQGRVSIVYINEVKANSFIFRNPLNFNQQHTMVDYSQPQAA